MKKIAVIAAMEKEAKLLQDLASDNLLIVTSGIGKVAAALKTSEIIHNFAPDLIINSGIAGGLDGSLNIGDTIIGSSVAYHDVWCGEPNAEGQVQGFPLYYKPDPDTLARFATDIRSGLIISGDQFISDKKTLESLKQQFPEALAVDMESAAIAQTCHIYNTPFVIFRMISDTPGIEHHQAQYDNFWKHAAENSFETIRRLISKIK